MEYTVTWTIDLTAKSPKEAARMALDIQRDPESLATHFLVRDEQGQEKEVDLNRENG